MKTVGSIVCASLIMLAMPSLATADSADPIEIFWDALGVTLTFEDGDTIKEAWGMPNLEDSSIVKAVELLENLEVAQSTKDWLLDHDLDTLALFKDFKAKYLPKSYQLEVWVGDEYWGGGFKPTRGEDCIEDCYRNCDAECRNHPYPDQCLRTCRAWCWFGCIWWIFVP